MSRADAFQCLLTLAVVAGLVPLCSGSRILKRRPPASATVSWAKFGGDAPLGRIPAAAVTCEGHLYIFGGETDDNNPKDPYQVSRYLNDLWAFKPSSGGSAASGDWTLLSEDDGPSARVSSSMVCSAGALTLFGGTQQGFESLGDVWSFNITRKQWTLLQADSAAAGGPGLLAAHTATLTDLDQDSMVVFGVRHPMTGTSDALWIFSLSSQTWTQKTQYFAPSPRDGHTAVALPGTAALRIWSGVSENTVWEYDIPSNWWTPQGFAPPFSNGRMGAHFEGRLWSFGGFVCRAATLST